MDRQKSMEKGLLRKSLSIRERKFPNDDLFLETGLSRKSPRDITKRSPRDIIRKSPRDIIKKAQNDDGECRVTAIVFLSTFVAVFGSFCTGCGAGFSSGAQSGITKDLSLSVAEYSMFASVLTLGGLIGAVFSGKVADVLGRKRTMLFCEAFCLTGWLAVALAEDALWLDCGRLLLGIGVGLFSYVIPVYIAEIAPKHVRGSFVFANQLLQNCGIALFFIIGNFIPHYPLFPLFAFAHMNVILETGSLLLTLPASSTCASPMSKHVLGVLHLVLIYMMFNYILQPLHELLLQPLKVVLAKG